MHAKLIEIAVPVVRHIVAPVARCLGGAALLLVAATACQPATPGDAATSPEAEVTLVGERTGLMVWRAVPEATAYRFELLGAGGAVLSSSESADTVASLPPLFMPDAESAWRVRALRDGRVIATSRVERVY
jgi:hypothetical protein